MTVHATIEPVHEPSARSDAAYATAVDTSVGSGLSARERRPYAPGELVSLWDMLRVHAADFNTLMKTLARVEIATLHTPMNFAVRGLDIEEDPETHRGACAGAWDVVGPLLAEMEPICERLGLNYSLCKIRRIREQFSGQVYEFSVLHASLGDLGNLINDQLNDRVFMFVPADRAEFFIEELPPFGPSVRHKFPEVAGDVMDASRCLGVGLPTGAVFY